MSSCTTLDHVYPLGKTGRKPADGTPCFCGKRRWNQDAADYAGPTAPAKPPRMPQVGSTVTLAARNGGVNVVVVDRVDRAESMFHAVAHVDGTVLDAGWHEPDEVVR